MPTMLNGISPPNARTLPRSHPPQAQAREPRSRQVRPPRRLGALPEWNLADLYPGIDAPEVKRDLDRADADSVAFEEAFKGKLAALAAARTPASALAEAVKRYEPLDDLLGRLISYAGLIYAGNTTDPARAKFYGDVQERITAASLASAVLHARTQPHRRRGARSRDGRSRARPLPAVDRGHPQGQAVPARGPRRAAVPREVGDRPMRPGTGCSTRPSRGLRFKVGGKSLAIEPTLNLLQDPREHDAQGGVAGAGEDLQGESAAVHADHQHARQGQGDFRPLARLRGRRRRAPSVEPGRARGGRCAGVGGARRLSAAVAPLLRAEGATGSARSGCRTGTATRRCRRSRRRTIGWSEARDTVLTAYGAFSPKMAEIAERFFDERLDRRAGAARQGAGRLRASDRAVGASLRAAQLSGQAARRDDARARTRPRRASGAGRAERRR